MSDKKTYYKLDDLGHIGDQDTKSLVEKKKMYDKTAKIIQSQKK